MLLRRFWPLLVALPGCLDEPVEPYEPEATPAALRFVEWAEPSGLVVEHRLGASAVDAFRREASPAEQALLPMAAGMTPGDVDGDGWIDLVVLRGRPRAAVFQNAGDGTFVDKTKEYQLDLDPLASGPLLADFDGDGLVDLLVAGIGDRHVELWRNVRGKSFVDMTEESGLRSEAKVLSVAAGDADGDGDLDVFLARYGTTTDPSTPQRELLWLNDGKGRFTDATESLDLPVPALGDAEAGSGLEVSVAPAFADLDLDGDQDLLVVRDLGHSAILSNELDGGLPVFRQGQRIQVPLGRGSALGDYDNDGDLDWFISGVDAAGLAAFEAGDGNHLFENRGDGTFRDVTKQAGVADGSFAWGSCFQDFDNDGDLDLFQVNGWGSHADGPDAGPLRHDASRFFLNEGDGTFREVSEAVGIVDEGEGRAVTCFDYDHDGDIDIAVTNAEGAVTFYGNTLNPWYHVGANYVCVSLIEGRGRTAVGARVSVRTGGAKQSRQVLLGSYVSQTATELHFGVGDQEQIDRIDIAWSDGDTGRVSDWRVNSCLEARHLPADP